MSQTGVAHAAFASRGFGLRSRHAGGFDSSKQQITLSMHGNGSDAAWLAAEKVKAERKTNANELKN
jgi:hypothetical protein